MSHPAHIALVGCGFTGTSAFYQLVDRYPAKRITIFEASGDFGPGYPYRRGECPDYLINNTTDTMCLVPSNRRAFVEWLRNGNGHAPIDEKGHLPRAVFGAFLKDAFQATRTSAAIKGIRVDLVPSVVTRMRETRDGGVVVGWAGGETAVDAAILTTGRCPPAADGLRPPAGATVRYVENHVMSDALDAVPPDATVHILGSSLSAFDVVNRLFSPRSGCGFEREPDGRLAFHAGANGRHVVLCSRSGRLKGAQSRHEMKLSRTRFALDAIRAEPVSPGAVGEAIRREATEHGARVDWSSVLDPYGGCASAADVNDRAARLLTQAIADATDPRGSNFLVDLLEDAQCDLWDAFAEQILSPKDEREYRDRLETAFQSYAAACPVSTAEKLLALHRAGRLRVVRGTRSVVLSDDGAAYRIAHGFGVEEATTLVNTTGSVERDVTSERQPPLIRDLVGAGLLGRYERDGVAMKGAAVDMTTFRAHGSRNVYVASMLLWGPGYFTSSARLMARVVERLLARLF